MVHDDPASGTIGMSTGSLVPVLTRAIQQQQEVIEQVQAENSELRDRMDRLEKALELVTSRPNRRAP